MAEDATVMYRAQVVTKNNPLSLRDEPGSFGSKIGSLPRGAEVDVLAEAYGWAYVSYGGKMGYASMAYLQRVDKEAEKAESVEIADGVTAEAVTATTLVREDAEGCITLIGRWHVAQD